jgi:hypothetical protein
MVKHILHPVPCFCWLRVFAIIEEARVNYRYLKTLPWVQVSSSILHLVYMYVIFSRSVDSLILFTSADTSAFSASHKRLNIHRTQEYVKFCDEFIAGINVSLLYNKT